jgi:Flagellar biosynthesis protein, FliO
VFELPDLLEVRDEAESGMTKERGSEQAVVAPTTAGGGLTGWVLARLGRGGSAQPRLALLERITLAPRQTLALVEAEGQRLLVATSPDGAPSFYPLDGSGLQAHTALTRRSRRVSW